MAVRGALAADLVQRAPLDRLPAIADEGPIELGTGEVDLWWCPYEKIDSEDLLARWEDWITDVERERKQRFKFPQHRKQFLATRALCRWALSRYAPVQPQTWRFGEGEHGKPFIRHPAAQRGVSFNLSNTMGMVVCAVSTHHRQLGVDVEAMDRRTEPLAIADRFFSDSEVRALHSLPSEQRRERFFSYWTLKESYIKARGMGLALPLGHFGFELDARSPISIAFSPELDDDPARWQFALLRHEDYLVAVGVDTGGEPLQLRAVRCLPGA
jgi:4'-phosphopantetheinyl transferase